jgi:hypothetical protein
LDNGHGDAATKKVFNKHRALLVWWVKRRKAWGSCRRERIWTAKKITLQYDLSVMEFTA